MFSYTTRLPRSERQTVVFSGGFKNIQPDAQLGVQSGVRTGTLPGTLPNLQADSFSPTLSAPLLNRPPSQLPDQLSAIPLAPPATEYPDLAGLVQQQFLFKQKLSETIGAKCEAHALKDQMLYKNIGELSRLIYTEVENLRSNVDPLNDVLADVVVGLQGSCGELLSSFSNEQEGLLAKLELEIGAHEEQIQLLYQQRAYTVYQMRAEFLLSADRLELQIQAEESEQQQQFSNIQRYLEEALKEQASVINQEYLKKTASLQDAKEDILASWTLAQRAVEKRYRDVQRSVQATTYELVGTNYQRLYAESEAIVSLKSAISEINKTLLVVGADVEILRGGIGEISGAAGTVLSGLGDAGSATSATAGAKAGKLTTGEDKAVAKAAGKTMAKDY